MRAEKTRSLRSGEVAKRLGLHPLTVRRWVKAGKRAAIPIGREARTGQKTMTLTDGGSGLVTSRKNLQRLLALVQDYQVAEVVVTFSNRLTRFGLSYLRALFSGYGVTLTVLHPDEEKTPEQELTEDLLAILASFAARLSGLRARTQQALLACAKQVLAEQEA